MGVDFYSCDNCGETFPDCGTYIHCEHGHRIGPCCFPLVEGHKWHRTDYWPDEQTVETDDYGTAVMEKFCPVCAKGGNESQRLAKAVDLLREWASAKRDEEYPYRATEAFLASINKTDA